MDMLNQVQGGRDLRPKGVEVRSMEQMLCDAVDSGLLTEEQRQAVLQTRNLSTPSHLDRIIVLLEKLVANTTPVAVHTSYSIDDLSGKPNAMRMQRTSREDDQVGKGGV